MTSSVGSASTTNAGSSTSSLSKPPIAASTSHTSLQSAIGSKPSKDRRTLRDVIVNELSQQKGGGSTVKLIGLNVTNILDSDVELLRNVERLSLRRNLLISLPSSFCLLKSVRYLDLESNILREIPPALLQCPKLEILDLSHNNIESLPQDISSLWSQQLKVLSLKNNNVASIWDLSPIVKLENLRVLEIVGNPIPNEELELVRTYTPIAANIVKEEYWAIALRRYLLNHPLPSRPFNVSDDTRISKAAKRMGFISTTSPVDSDRGVSITSSPVSYTAPNSGNDTDTAFSNNENASNNNDLYNHSKFNDYFKRLSVLPEESANHEQHKVSHDELLIACRKLLFSFTECQQNIRKIASFCKEKSVAVSVVSLLYSVRSHIDDLVEVLEQAENEDKSHDGALIKLCITIISIFKNIIGQLRKNFKSFFEADDLCFIRMFYMTLLCSYTEIYNAWCYIDAEEAKLSRKKQRARGQSAIVRPSSGGNSTGAQVAGAAYLPRTRSNTLQSRAPPNGLSISTAGPSSNEASHGNGSNVAGYPSSIISPSLHTTSPPHTLLSQISPRATTPPQGSSTVSSISQLSFDFKHGEQSPRQHHGNSPRAQKSSEGFQVNTRDGGTDSESGSPSGGGTNVDVQLYQTLRTVIIMVNVVYDQLTSEISKAALASTTGQQELTDSLLTKIRSLTDTCCQAMELSKILNERLQLLMSDLEISEKYFTTGEKVKTWESINAFLKSIISILASTKIVMTDMPALNEIRPNLASLAKITKDVTVILDLSSYKGVSVIAVQNQQQLQHQHQQQLQQQSEIPEDQRDAAQYFRVTSTPQPPLQTTSNEE
ncbi:hypothetical protein HG535_0E02450 [Zygotorulaspora mrakii]|uniref:RAM signaling network component n=1 Tax=Zygotorulaspora mrakii TaxID=42260 RepID=A0A7H9B3C6_ZYGMR|nr:uncharacterized protein HG535_0E02450 [Zygotorulaspora mrakii]QLG73161.1 hypothetical protein HG535_0E02450 [Zygotorulaspora mrakii]